MKTIIFLFAICVSLRAQSVGSVTQVNATSSVITGVAGNLKCALSKTDPLTAGRVHMECAVSGANVKVSDVVIPVGPGGIVDSYKNGTDIITWLVTRPTAAGAFVWQMSANGVSQNGTL